MADAPETVKSPLGLWVVEPWFGAIGHPAQSLQNTMRTLRDVCGVDYLVAENSAFTHHADLRDALGVGQRLFRFEIQGDSLKDNTKKSLLAALRLIRFVRRARCLLFLDMDLVTLAKWWPALAPFLKVGRISLLYLLGPESVLGHESARRRVERLLRREDVMLCLRTQELQLDWAAAFPDIPKSRFRTLPSLEIPEGTRAPVRPRNSRKDVRFGLLGQLRRGKSIETLVPLFESQVGLGVLTVAGSFASAAERAALQVLHGFGGFEERYFEESDLLSLTSAQDYLLVLYDQWDKRMESAVLYLSMRAGRPVVVYAEGWCERMVSLYGCGVAMPRSHPDLAGFLSSLPLPGSSEYALLIDGVSRFQEAHRPELLLPRFIESLGLGASREVQ